MENGKILHGDFYDNDYLLIEEDGELLIVHADYYQYESAIIFTVGHVNTDWSDGMLLDFAKKTVDLLNGGANE